MTLKLLHIADLHLGLKTYERWLGGRPARLDESLAALDAILDLALAERVHLVVAAGDIYDSPRAQPLVQREWARRVARLRAAHVPLVIVPGNHDRPRRDPAVSGQAVFAALSLEGVYIAAAPTLIEIETAAGPITVAAAPWRSDGDRERVRAAEEELDHLVHDEWAPRLGGRRAIFVGHVWLAGGFPSSEGALIFDESQIAPATVSLPAFDYYALGHLHTHQEVSVPAGGPAVYAGAITRHNFSDEGVPKGAVLVEIGAAGTRWRFAEVASREFVTVAVDASRGEDLETSLRAAAASQNFDGAIVRVRIAGQLADPDQRAHHEIAAAFPGAFAVKVTFGAPPAAHRERRGIPPETDVREALRQYISRHPPPLDFSLEELLARVAAWEP